MRNRRPFISCGFRSFLGSSYSIFLCNWLNSDMLCQGLWALAHFWLRSILNFNRFNLFRSWRKWREQIGGALVLYFGSSYLVTVKNLWLLSHSLCDGPWCLVTLITYTAYAHGMLFLVRYFFGQNGFYLCYTGDLRPLLYGRIALISFDNCSYMCIIDQRGPHECLCHRLFRIWKFLLSLAQVRYSGHTGVSNALHDFIVP